jgi:glycine/D-amino acid oxidase-like deaminating enzyme
MTRGAGIVVVGAGLVGAALALGLRDAGADVLLVDEADAGLRASRGNFGLVWVQGKGATFPPYAELTRRSRTLWPEFAADLAERSGIDPHFEATGGLEIALDEPELETLNANLAACALTNGWSSSDCAPLSRAECQDRFGATLGAAVPGGVWCAHDGVVNPLRLLQALHRAFVGAGGCIAAGTPVTGIGGRPPVVALADGRRLEADLVVLAAGLGIAPLARGVGIDVPIRPERGQILVTERLRHLIRMPSAALRQTQDGTILIGATREDAGFSTATSLEAQRELTRRAIATCPGLADARLTRGWAALRVLTPDGAPIYDRPDSDVPVVVVTCHSGVTLAAAHARLLAPAIASGALASGFRPFGLNRFTKPPEHNLKS